MIHSRHAHSFDKIIKWKQEVDEQYKQLIEGQTDGKHRQIKHVRHLADTPGVTHAVTHAVTQLGEQVECPHYNTPLGNPAENSHAGLLAEDVPARLSILLPHG